MKKLFCLLLLLVFVSPVMAISADTVLDQNEIILDERVLSDGTREIFTQLEEKYYRKFIQGGQLINTESIELRPTGLKTSIAKKDPRLGETLSKKLKEMDIYSDNLPAQLDYSASPYLPPVGEQMENSCVGWAAGYYLRTYQQGQDLGWSITNNGQINPYRVFSPSFIYNQINYEADDGAYMEDAGALLMDMGAAPLSYFPYIPGDYLTQPDAQAIQAGYPHRIRDWRILYTRNDSWNDIIQKTKEYLNTGDLVVAGINVGFKFNYPLMDYLGNAIITTDYYANNGHAVVVVGYDDYILTPEGYGAFKIINSYGTDWGNEGFAYLSYDAYVYNIHAGYVFTDLVNQIDDFPVKELSVTESCSVAFNINFEGTGQYDLAVKNEQNHIIYEEKGLSAQSGLEVFIWDGRDNNGVSVLPGNYRLAITPYNSQREAKPDFLHPFVKENNVVSFQAHSYWNGDDLLGVKLSLKPAALATVAIDLVHDAKKYPLITDVATHPNKEYIYIIDETSLSQIVDSLDNISFEVTIAGRE